MMTNLSILAVADSSDVASTWNGVSSVSSILWSFYHWWQLKFLIVGVITFLSWVSFSATHYFFVELNLLIT